VWNYGVDRGRARIVAAVLATSTTPALRTTPPRAGAPLYRYIRQTIRRVAARLPKPVHGLLTRLALQSCLELHLHCSETSKRLLAPSNTTSPLSQAHAGHHGRCT
jgi:hypothetical protein